MFASPVYSGWKPEPSSSSAPTRPLTATRAARRLDHAGDDLQQRRLAGAVLADDAERFAARAASNDTSSSARNTCAAPRPRKQVEDEAHASAARLDFRVVLADACECSSGASGAGSARRRRQCDAAARSHEILEMRRQPPEHPAAGGEQRERDDDAPAHRRGCSARRPSSRASRKRPTSQPNGLAATQGRTPSGTSVSGYRIGVRYIRIIRSGISTCSTSLDEHLQRRKRRASVP